MKHIFCRTFFLSVSVEFTQISLKKQSNQPGSWWVFIIYQLFSVDCPSLSLVFGLTTDWDHSYCFFVFFFFPSIFFSSVSQHNTSKLVWSETMDLCTYVWTYVTRSLRDLKKFFNRGLYLRLEEENVHKSKTWWGFLGLLNLLKHIQYLAFDMLGAVSSCTRTRHPSGQMQSSCKREERLEERGNKFVISFFQSYKVQTH